MSPTSTPQHRQHRKKKENNIKKEKKKKRACWSSHLPSRRASMVLRAAVPVSLRACPSPNPHPLPSTVHRLRF
eukprot:194578-Rhodomonas_salina.1